MSDMKLYEGISHIDDDLIDEANVPARRHRYYTFALSAAAILLVIGVSGIALGGNGKYSPHRYTSVDTSSATTTECSTTTASSQVSVTTGAGTTASVTSGIVRETSPTTAANNEGSYSPAETSVKANTNVTAPQVTQTAQALTSAAANTTASVLHTTAAVTDIPQTTALPAVTTDANEDERSFDMKKAISLLSSAVMLSPIAVKNAYTADLAYKDPAERYGLGSANYSEEVEYVGPAEQELFDRIDNGLIDIDIDRNGELDMRDAALLYFYETRRYILENPEEADSFATPLTLNSINSFDNSSISDEVWDFLDSREDIRDKELFDKSRNYSPVEVAHLDSDLIIRYNLTHTIRPEYFTKNYYSELEYYYLISNRFEGQVGWERDKLINTIREAFFTELDPLYDLNGDGVFDLHDVQDYVEYQFMYKVYRADYSNIVNADHVDITKYREYPNSDDSITETVFKNCVKLEMVNGEYEDLYAWDFQKGSGINGIVQIGFQRLIELYFMRNDFRLIYATPEYYTDERPGCEGLPLYDRIDFYSFVKQYAGSRGYTTTKLGFNETTFNMFYEEWSAAVDNGTADLPDVNGNGIIDKDDLSFLNQYEKEIWAKTPAADTVLPKNIRKFLDTEFDINENGISGDLYDVMGAGLYIRANYPELKTDVSTSAVSGTTVSLQKGDANCDGKVSVADSVAILQFIGNRDRYDLKPQGKKNADVNGDGSVTGSDALEIQKMDAGIIVIE
jgi:hypothetical protein